MSTVDNKIIPNQLNIIIRTSIPGYQNLEYKPEMTIPDISRDDKSIRFNPLVKLSKSKVDKVPENLRKKQFFNKGLFDSLINFTGEIPAKSLLQATRNGFVDNNIKVTLDTIFPENGVLYINKKPYAIADFQWSKGDWKVDTKIKKSQLDSSKISDPALYQTVVKDEIISGENQLQTLPPTLIYGANYTGPKDVTTTTSATKTSTASGVRPPPPPASSSTSSSSSAYRIVPPKPPSVPKSTILTIKNDVDDEDNDDNEYKKPIKLITNSDSDDESTTQSSKNYPNVIEPITKMLVSTRTTTTLRNFFKEDRFFTLINMIYAASSENTKMVIQTSLTEYLTIDSADINELNRQAYLKNVLDIKTIRNIGQGNCFFIAVADAINYHNYYNQKNRIISGRYGSGINLYTQKYLRELVFKYLQTWGELDRYLVNIAPVNADDLNDLFEQQINAIKLASGSPDEIAPDVYVRIANDIFNSRDNFLLKNVEGVPIDISDYYTPFKVLEKQQIQRYILSNNFWANEIVINALCVELQLNVIPFETIKTPSGKSTLRIPYANFSPILNNWNKYLFIYYNQGHYELITFNKKIMPQKIVSTGRLLTRKIKKSKIIFDRNDNISEIPPIYILFTIYGSYFSSIVTRQEKETFTFKKEIMLTIQNIINNNLYNRPDYNTIFYPLFKLYFPDSYIQENSAELNKKANVKLPISYNSAIVPFKSSRGGDSQEPDDTDYHGGAYPRYNPYYRPTYYPQYNMAHNLEKKDKESSQLAYTITIDMELSPGTSLSPAELTHSKCNSKWNSIRKSWSELTGKPYVIPPVYKNKEETNKTQNIRPDQQNNTRKYYKGGKHNKTVKLYY